MEFAHWKLWNLVDVAVDGPARRGLVVDITDSQLVVDFGIPNQPPELVDYENAYHDFCDPEAFDPEDFAFEWMYDEENEDYDYDSDEDEDIFPNKPESSKTPNTEVLVRLSADQPCTWYPARVVAGRSAASGCSCLLMDVHVPGGCVRKVFRPDHVMCLGYSSTPDRRVKQGNFVKEMAVVPEGFEGTQQFFTAWKDRLPDTYPVGVVGNQFFFIENRLYFSRERYLKKEEGDQRLYAIMDWDLSSEAIYKIKREPEDMDTVVGCEKETSDNGLTLGHLPPGIHEMILSFLDLKNESIVRRVCRLWNWILTTFIHGRLIIVNIDNVDQEVPDTSIRSWCDLASCLQKRFALRKYPVYFAVSGQKPDRLPVLIDVLQGLVSQDGGMKVKNLIFGNMSLSRSHLCSIPLRHLQSICNRLVFKDVVISKLFGSYVTFRDLPACRIPYEDAYIPCASVSCPTRQGLLDVFEEAAKRYCFTDDAGKCDVERVADWIRRMSENTDNLIVSREHSVDREHVLKILRKWEIGTLFFEREISWEKVISTQLDANLFDLRKSTLSALICSEKDRWYQRNVLKVLVLN